MESRGKILNKEEGKDLPWTVPQCHGSFSCLYSCCDADHAAAAASSSEEILNERILNLYEDALNRLPWEDMPELIQLMSTGGLCVGLLDPVSNIILNTVSLLPSGFLNTVSPQVPGFPEAGPRKSRRLATKAIANPTEKMSTFYNIASRSYLALIGFLLDYFGCLTQEQAVRYLRWANADLALAVWLVKFDLWLPYPGSFHMLVGQVPNPESVRTQARLELAAACKAGPRFRTRQAKQVPSPGSRRTQDTIEVVMCTHEGRQDKQVPDPGSGRTQASLELAVRRTGHPAPDRLVHLTSSLFSRQRLEAIKSLLLAGGTKLTVNDVDLLLRLLQDGGATSNVHATLLPQGGLVTRVLKQAVDEGAVASETSDLGDGYITTTVKPVGDYITSLRSHQDMRHEERLCLEKANDLRSRLKECGQCCEHLQSLEMRTRDTVHSFYLDAIALLPCEGANWLIRDILVAGHCYGPLKPVANIIVNSIWHNRLSPLPVADCSARYDILDTLSILRTEVRSLDGIMEVLRVLLSDKSTREILRTLCRNQCDISGLAFEDRNFSYFKERPNDLLLRAAVAAQHPLPAALALFHNQLLENKNMMKNLNSLINTTGVLSVADIHLIADTVDAIFKITPEVQSSLQPQVPQLHKDAYSILLKKRSEYECQSDYLRAKVVQLLEKYATEHPWEKKYTLGVICGVEKCGYLFTEGYRMNFMGYSPNGKGTLFFAEFWVSNPGDPKPDICCPLDPPYTGRCFYSKNSAKKIVYPNSAHNFMCDVTAYGVSNVDDIIDADFVYFNSERDAKFAEKVNSYYAENSLWRPTILDTDTKHFASIRFADHYSCSSVAEPGIRLSLGETVCVDGHKARGSPKLGSVSEKLSSDSKKLAQPRKSSAQPRKSSAQPRKYPRALAKLC